MGRLYPSVRERLYPAVMEESISIEREETVSNREGELTSLGLICTVSLKGSVYLTVKVGPPVHNYEHEAGSYGDGFT